MRKALKIGAWVVAGLLVLAVATALVITIFFQDEIKQRFEAALNDQLEAEVVLAGDASFSFFRHFPKASISFTDVTVMGGPGFSADTLLHAGRVAFLFNPFALYKGHYEVHTVEVARGFLHLEEDENGNANYSIWQADTTQTATQEPVQLELADARLADLQCRYTQSAAGQRYHGHIDQMQLSGAWYSDDFTAQVSGQMVVKEIREQGVTYVEALPLELQVAVDIALQEGRYRLLPSSIKVAGDAYQLRGDWTTTSIGWDMDVSLQGQSVSLGSMIALLPPAWREQWQGWDSEGDLNFTATLQGPWSNIAAPAIAVTFDLQEGMLTHPDLSRGITAVTLDGNFTNGSAQALATSRLEISDFSGQMGNDPLDFSLVVDNWAQPHVTLSANATMDVRQWRGLLEPLGWAQAAGRLELKDIYLSGAVEDWTTGRYSHRTEATGRVTVAALEGETEGQSWSVPVGQLALDKQRLQWEELVVLAGQSDVTTSGAIQNLWNFLSQVAQGDTTAVLEVDALVTGEQLDWADVMAFVPTGSASSPEEAINYLPYFQRIRGQVDVDFRAFVFEPFQSQSVKGRVRWSPYLTRLDGLALETAGGTLQGDGFLRVVNDQLVLEGQVLGRGVEVDDLFLGFDNFWQDFLVAENLKGTVDGDINCYVAWAQDLSFVEESTSIQAELTVRDGELVDFAPMEELSDFVKVKELRHIQFSELRNDIRVEGSRVILPAMQIKSTAMNLWISGTHTFDNTIDYQMQIDLLDVLARKVKLGKMKLEQAEQREDGLFNLYVTMTGTVDDPVFATDKAAVLARFEESRSLLDPTFLNFNEPEQQRETRITPQDVEEGELDYIDW